MFTVDQYYVQIDKNLENVIGGPIYGIDQMNDVGTITKYNPETGFIKVQLYLPTDYKNLVRSGIPLSNIIFPFQA